MKAWHSSVFFLVLKFSITSILLWNVCQNSMCALPSRILRALSQEAEVFVFYFLRTTSLLCWPSAKRTEAAPSGGGATVGGAVRLLPLLSLPGIHSQQQPVIMATVRVTGRAGRAGLDWSKLEWCAGCRAQALCLIRPILLSRRCLFPLRLSSPRWSLLGSQTEAENHYYAHTSAHTRLQPDCHAGS